MIISIEQLYKIYLQHPLVSTDTRKVTAESLFFALKGDKFDANAFAQQAIESGAAYAIIDNPAFQLNEKYLLVADVLTALQDLARYHREQLTIPVIGLTGSNGKTTTKELIYAVLSQKFKTLATQGNLNNHIGVPLTVLSISQSHEMAVVEMGANHQKEIEFLCGIARPAHGLITNVGKAHLEGFGGVEGVKKGKGELYDFLKESESPKVGKSEKSESQEAEESERVAYLTSRLSDFPSSGLPDFRTSRLSDSPGVAFVNRDSPDLMKMQTDRGLDKVFFYGTGNDGNLISGELTENAPYLALQWTNNISGESHSLKTNLTGAYNLDNILAAICIGVYFGLTDAEVNKGIESYTPKNNRSQIVQTETNTLICDYYNANPSSMMVAIENMDKIAAKSKVLILGDMFELGDDSAAEHASVMKKAMGIIADRRIFIGAMFYSLSPEVRKSGSPEAEATTVSLPPPLPELSPANGNASGALPLLELSPTNGNVSGEHVAPELVGDNFNEGGVLPRNLLETTPTSAEGKDNIFYKITEDAINGLKTNPIKNATILIKGSRGMALERLVDLF